MAKISWIRQNKPIKRFNYPKSLNEVVISQIQTALANLAKINHLLAFDRTLNPEQRRNLEISREYIINKLELP